MNPIEVQAVSAHKFATAARHAGRTFRLTLAGKPAAPSVACGNCNACCREVQAIRLQGGEAANPRLRHDGTHLLRNPDGSCTHLVDGRCEVYADRPLTCRAYDCRVAPLAQVIEDDVPDTLRAAFSRVAPPRDAEDLAYHFAVKMLMAKTMERSEAEMTPALAAAIALATVTPQLLGAGAAEVAALRERAPRRGIDESLAVSEACAQISGAWDSVAALNKEQVESAQ